jgi:hypothetical protein
LDCKIVIGGHSHLNAMVGDRHEEKPTLRALAGQEDVAVLDGSWPRDETYWSGLAEAAPGKRIGLIWGGNEHNSVYFFQAAYEFDFASRHVSALLGNAQVVSQRTIKQRFRKLSLDDMDAALTKISAAKPERLALIGTPPPKKDSEKLRVMLEREPAFVAWAKQINSPLETIGITDPHVRLKLWYLLQDMFREAAASYDAEFISVPPEVQDAEGFLREELWAPDVTHANAEYGRIMLAKIIGELRA